MSRSPARGVRAKGKDRIEFTLYYEGRRYRPTLVSVPSEANLRRARTQLEAIEDRIKKGTFDFNEEFPDFGFKNKLPATTVERTCGEIFDVFLKECEARVAMNDMAFIWTPPRWQGHSRCDDRQVRLQFYIRPVGAGRSLLALMESADPRLISPEGSKPGTLMQVWRVTV